MRRLLLSIVCCAIGCTSPADPGVSITIQPIAPDAIVVGDDDAITISPNEIDLVGAAGTLQMTGFTVNGSGLSTNVVSIEFIDGDTTGAFSSVPPCTSNGLPCAVAPPNMVPLPGMVSCTPSATSRSAKIRVTSNTGVTGTALVTCSTPASNPSFTIPNTVGPLSVAVGSMQSDALRVTNNGDQPLMITVALDPQDPDTPEWTVSMCLAGSPCPLPVGTVVDIPVELHPSRHGTLDTNITVTGPPAGSQTATLIGTGVGGFLRVDQPATFEHDFGTIAKGQTVAFPVEMTNLGNADITVTPSDPGTPFSVSTSPIPVPGNAGTGMFDITCSSPTALVATMKTIDLTLSANTYDNNTDTIMVRCAIADTTVQVTNPLDFGELRVGEPAGTLEVEITNPADGGAAVMITRIELVGAPAALTTDPVMPPITLADGDQLTTQLHLATDADVTLDNVRLQIDVIEGTAVTLDLPVSGKVATPAAVVLPLELALGEVCVGTPVASGVTMTNTGTAKLLVQEPTMTSTSFVPVLTSPQSYPAPLLPADKAMVGVMAASSTPGKLAGTLEWSVDVPEGMFEIPISLELLGEGTAVSPAKLTFGTANIDEPSLARQTITVENCGPEPAMLRYDRVNARTGAASAWKLDPPSQARTLLAGEQTRIRVGFEPREKGPHAAVLPIDVDGVERVVDLTGDAIGGGEREETSFYACGCSGSRAPAAGWPLLLVLLIVLRRRRC
jgi:MYXO-CTERM domain-containing protein